VALFALFALNLDTAFFVTGVAALCRYQGSPLLVLIRGSLDMAVVAFESCGVNFVGESKRRLTAFTAESNPYHSFFVTIHAPRVLVFHLKGGFIDFMAIFANCAVLSMFDMEKRFHPCCIEHPGDRNPD
jgi:hypothetical protein